MSIFTDPYQDSYPPALYTVPVLTSIAPSTGVVGVSTTVTLTGTGFFPTTQGYVDGVAKPTVYVVPTQVWVTWTPAAPGTVQVTARNGGQVTASKAFTVTAAQAFDPAAYSVGEVLEYVADHPEEVHAVLAKERAGKHRPRLIAALEDLAD